MGEPTTTDMMMEFIYFMFITMYVVCGLYTGIYLSVKEKWDEVSSVIGGVLWPFIIGLWIRSKFWQNVKRSFFKESHDR